MRKYHHGDARSALLAAAGELIEENGAANLSLRQVAEKAGISRQAPYNHFVDKEALLAEVVKNSFDELCSQLDGLIKEKLISGVDKLTRAAETYISFATTKPAHFRLMFSKEIVDLSKFPLSQASAENAFGLLSKIVSEATSSDNADLSISAWCLVHGYATLCVEARIENSQVLSQRARLFASLIAGNRL